MTSRRCEKAIDEGRASGRRQAVKGFLERIDRREAANVLSAGVFVLRWRLVQVGVVMACAVAGTPGKRGGDG